MLTELNKQKYCQSASEDFDDKIKIYLDYIKQPIVSFSQEDQEEHESSQRDEDFEGYNQFKQTQYKKEEKKTCTAVKVPKSNIDWEGKESRILWESGRKTSKLNAKTKELLKQHINYARIKPKKLALSLSDEDAPNILDEIKNTRRFFESKTKMSFLRLGSNSNFSSTKIVKSPQNTFQAYNKNIAMQLGDY